nr:hypothetical protein [uncultured Lichenicoccus sp.]
MAQTGFGFLGDTEDTSDRLTDLRSRAERLASDLVEAHAEVAQAKTIQGPYERAFRDAHDDLVLLHLRRACGEAISKPALFAAYDKRMVLGHQWNPHRQRLNDAERWRKAIFDELRQVNAEIGR